MDKVLVVDMLKYLHENKLNSIFDGNISWKKRNDKGFNITPSSVRKCDLTIDKEIFDENDPEIEIILANDKIYIAKIGKMIVTIGEYCHYENKIFEYSNARIFYV